MHPIIEQYIAFSPGSQALAKRAVEVFPGGDTRASAHYGTYPLAMAHAEGCVLTDVDGHEIIDFMNNFTSLIHGHAHPDVVEAVQSQVAQGSAYAAPNESQIALAEMVVDRVPSIEQLRFTSSGTEGTNMALRCSRAATGRQKIMKMEGGYHGSYEQAEVALAPIPGLRGAIEAPVSTAMDGSFSDSVLADTVICPYNEPEMAEALIKKHADELAAVIVEPVMGSMGMVAATTEFLQSLREATQRYGIILIFDEVITLRLAQGGAQETHGIVPDLTCMGKIIGGGLPVGGIGGRRDLMQLFSPEAEMPVMHASTFSGNALTMAAGFAAMSKFDADENKRINDLGGQLREGFNQAFQQSGIKGQALGSGSLSNVLFLDGEVTNARQSFDSMIEANNVSQLLHLLMLQRGVFSASRLMYCTSTAMTEAEVSTAVTAMHESLAELRPYLEKENPQLLR